MIRKGVLLKAFVRVIDVINGWIGKVVGWFTLILVLITVYDVVMRYVFHAGSVAFMELEVHLFAMNFMLAAGWTLLVGAGSASGTVLKTAVSLFMSGVRVVPAIVR